MPILAYATDSSYVLIYFSTLLYIISAQLTEGYYSVLIRNHNRRVPLRNWYLRRLMQPLQQLYETIPFWSWIRPFADHPGRVACSSSPVSGDSWEHELRSSNTSELWNPDPVTQNHKIVSKQLFTQCDVSQGNLCI